MCGCSSNFDGHSDLEEIENVKYLDFDGDDFVDEDFDGFIGKKAKARREVRQTNRAVNNSSKFTSYDDCMAKKPLLISKNIWGSTCDKQFPAPAEEKQGVFLPATNSGVSSPANKKNILTDISNIAERKGSDIINKSESNVIMSSTDDEPKKAGFFAGNKGYMIGGILILGLGIFAMSRLRRAN
jgi:hypothetical protein